MDITSYLEFVRIRFTKINRKRNKIFLHIRNYHTLRTMHVRGDQSPNQVMRRPLTAAQESK
jgi:hypothetical protein